VKLWPWSVPRLPGITPADIDGDGQVLTMRIPDAHGAWVCHPADPRVMIPVDHAASPLSYGTATGEAAGVPRESVVRYRLLVEGLIDNYDGFTIPVPDDTASLDLNRNFPAGWGKEVKGSGDHALSEPEVHPTCTCIVPTTTTLRNISHTTDQSFGESYPSATKCVRLQCLPHEWRNFHSPVLHPPRL
jgi:hypothetical protein